LISKQRVKTAIEHLLPDRVPLGELVVEEGFIRKYLGRDTVDTAQKAEFFRAVGLDLICSSEPGEVAYFSRETDLFVFGLVQGGFSGLLRGCGDFVEAMLLIGRDAGAAAGIMEKELTGSREMALQLLRSGAHGVMVADDIAYNKGLYVSPETLQKIYFPSLAGTVRILKEAGHPVFFHSDGNLNQILLDLKEAGFDGLQCLEQKAGMVLAELKERFRDELCFMGGVDLNEVASDLREEELEKVVRETLLVGALGGGYIFGTNGGLFEGLSPKVVERIYRLALQLGRY